MPIKFRKNKKSALRVTVPKKARSQAIEKLRVNNIKKIVKRVMKSSDEVKCAPVLTLADQGVIAGTGLNVSTGYGLTPTTNIVPQIALGTADGQRIGNVVNTKKLVLKYTIRALPVTSTGGTNPKPALPFLCRVIVYRHRYAIDDYGNTGILDVGGSSANLGSTPDLWVEPYNKKEFIIAYSKQYLMQPITNNSGASTVADNVANGTKQFVWGKVKIKMPKKLQFNDSNNVPTNAGWYVAFAVCNTDGTGDLLTIYRAQVNCESYLYYTDP